MATLRPYELPPTYSLGSASLFAKLTAPFPFKFVLIRQDRCLILFSRFVRDEHPPASILDGDVIVDFKGMADLETRKLPILEGTAAEGVILKDEANRTAKGSVPNTPPEFKNAGKAPPPGDGRIFWAGKKPDHIRSWEIKPWHIIRHGIGLACVIEPSPVSGALIRNQRCFVFPMRVENAAGDLPILPGDQFLLFHGSDELKAMGLSPLEGDDAVVTLLAEEEFRLEDQAKAAGSLKSASGAVETEAKGTAKRPGVPTEASRPTEKKQP